ncbi:conserved protein of unknown function [Xenorhabdus poinarii G6]|uniref:Uncharacterized protein n=1 Tax=Xenorhabdus poinarii G6 TaxID=1354304 RepID=A0A068R5Y0_9GAMM|nr:hypothetical protein [Xenorhabdus poinarii]CDG22291.1 conserved protein of unknown function [Xenorhabdus poinarii G6]
MHIPTQDSNTASATRPSEPEKKDVDSVSEKLITAMSCERTLAVQAALAEQPTVAVALLTWSCCLKIFGNGWSKSADCFKASLTTQQGALIGNAPSGKQGKAYLFLMQEKARIAAKLPENWSADYDLLLAWSVEQVNALLGFCTVFGIDGVQERQYGKTSNSKLDRLESVLNFDLRDWWQPTAEGYFSRIKKEQIADALTEAGFTPQAQSALKMKKGDAAAMAEAEIGKTRWVPAWMKAEGDTVATSAAESDDPADDKVAA